MEECYTESDSDDVDEDKDDLSEVPNQISENLMTKNSTNPIKTVKFMNTRSGVHRLSKK